MPEKDYSVSQQRRGKFSGKPAEKEVPKNEGTQENTKSALKIVDEKSRLHLIKEQNLALLMVVSYSDQIFNYLFDSENRYQIPRDHLSGQAFNPSMRSVLVNWLADVAYHMNLYQETVQLTIYILDKFMSIDKTTTKDNAQLIGLGALFIAAKYEETEAITLMDLRRLCNVWTFEDLKRTENVILRTIGYDLGKPLPIHFIRRFSERGRASPMEHNYAKYFADSFLLCYSYSHDKSSTIAAASVFLALCLAEERVDSTLWTPHMATVSRHQIVDFSHLLSSIAKIVTSCLASRLGALHSRYASADLHCVSLMPGCQPGRGIINHFCID
ncbi:cyclin b [Nesidiocoris tenuis]|uniref:Cyclin b n=1 Tax=Nesidiocoris tenuis TaxID=355587 RepID=A0ABN7APR6_9HEMI|nr:cyclin b [Nesidiocoris tenuis]